MRVLKKMLFAGIGFALFLGASIQANAGMVVTSDNGNSPVTLTGTAAGLDLTFGSGATITTVNNLAVTPLPVTFSTIDFTGTASSLTGTGSKTITDGTDTVIVSFTLTATVNTFGGNNYLLISGSVTNVSESNAGGGTYNWTSLTGVSIAVAQVGTGIAALVGNSSGTPIATSANFSQVGVQAIPEPSSVLLMGLGIIGLVGLRSLRNRSY